METIEPRQTKYVAIFKDGRVVTANTKHQLINNKLGVAVEMGAVLPAEIFRVNQVKVSDVLMSENGVEVVDMPPRPKRIKKEKGVAIENPDSKSSK